jgi:predicted RNase H-like nuclease (RuvC/YqgF family)
MTSVDDSGGSDNDDDRRPNETIEDAKKRKRKERLEQNRISARESRKRKKSMIEELQRTVIALSRENKELNERNEKLRSQLIEIGQKVCITIMMINKNILRNHESRIRQRHILN